MSAFDFVYQTIPDTHALTPTSTTPMYYKYASPMECLGMGYQTALTPDALSIPENTGYDQTFNRRVDGETH